MQLRAALIAQGMAVDLRLDLAQGTDWDGGCGGAGRGAGQASRSLTTATCMMGSGGTAGVTGEVGLGEGGVYSV